MKKILWALTLALAAVAAVMWIRDGIYSKTEYMLNTVITISADNKTAVDKCFEEIKRIEKLLSTYLPGSDVSRINSSVKGQAVKVSDETIGLLQKAEEYKRLTDGAFDISIKPIVDLWDISGGGKVPDKNQLAQAVKCIGDVMIDKDASTVTLPREGMAIDLGAIAKGYASDRVKDILISAGVKSAVADLGGNIVAIGKNGKRNWRIGLQHPLKVRGSTFAYIEVEDKCVVTSGGYERYFERGGKVYHHIIDPATGENPENDVLSVTVVSENGAMADALSTACYVAGKDKALEIAEKMSADVIIYTENGVYHSKGIENSLFLTEVTQ